MSNPIVNGPTNSNMSTFLIRPGDDQVLVDHGAAYVDPLISLAQQSGITDAINSMNNQSQEEQAQLHEDYYNNQVPQQEQREFQNQESYEEEAFENEEPQDSDQPKQKKKRRSKAVNNLSGYADRQRKEKERLEKVFAAKEEMHKKELEQKEAEKQFIERAYRLEMEKRDVTDNIEKVTDILLTAKQNNDYQTEVDANILMQKLINQQQANERSYQDTIQEAEQTRQYYAEPEADPEEEEFEELANQELYRYSDAKDLSSSHYIDFLADYPVCNPHSPEYDRGLADKIWSIRTELNEDLKINGEGSYIGTAQYYNEVQSLISERFAKRTRNQGARNAPSQQQYYSDDQQYMPQPSNYGEEDMPAFTIQPFGQHYDQGYSPNYDPNFRKSSDFRNEDGNFVDHSGGYVGAGAPPENVNYHRGPSQQAYQPQPQQYVPRGQSQGQQYAPQQQQYASRQAPVYQQPPMAPVNRQGYGMASRPNISLTPEQEHKARELGTTMANSMFHPSGPKEGQKMTVEESIAYHRNYYANGNNN